MKKLGTQRQSAEAPWRPPHEPYFPPAEMWAAAGAALPRCLLYGISGMWVALPDLTNKDTEQLVKYKF